MNLKEKLKAEGFTHVYEWTDMPHTVYPSHSHKGKVSFYIINGEILMYINDEEKILKNGDRIDVPVGVEHSAKVGPEGCTFIVGEEIEGDS